MMSRYVPLPLLFVLALPGGGPANDLAAPVPAAVISPATPWFVLDEDQRIRNMDDAEALRAAALEAIFGSPVLPSRVPEGVERIHDEMLGRNVERLTIRTEGVLSVAYLLEPDGPRNGQLAIYHEGHVQDFRTEGARTIQALLDAGFDVLAFAMPLKGINGTGTAGWHIRLATLERPLRFFVEPVVVGLNWASRRRAYDQIIMLGLSGGGWTTELASALDRRIDRSYSIAGSWPRYLRELSGRETDIGDFEQGLIGTGELPSYLELYVMAADEGRVFVQIFNRDDPCCFAGVWAEDYRDYVATRTAALGGRFIMHVDGSHAEHMISDEALSLVIQDATTCRAPH